MLKSREINKKMRETVEWQESFCEFALDSLEDLVFGQIYFEKFCEQLYKATGEMQLIWLLQKEMFYILKTNHMHWKLCKANEILTSQFEGFHPEKNTLHKGMANLIFIHLMLRVMALD